MQSPQPGRGSRRRSAPSARCGADRSRRAISRASRSPSPRSPGRSSCRRRRRPSAFDWSDPARVCDKLREETAEIEEALAAGDRAHVADEVGDLLFTVANLARHLQVDPEAALRAGKRQVHAPLQAHGTGARAGRARDGRDRSRGARTSLGRGEDGGGLTPYSAAERGATERSRISRAKRRRTGSSFAGATRTESISAPSARVLRSRTSAFS